MREIKFRAWDKNLKAMLFPPMKLIGEMIDEELEENMCFMQYTGLKDKNGVEIYEGDIVIYRITRSPNGYEEHEDFKGVVKWDKGAFWTGFEIDHGNQWNRGSGNSLLSSVISDFRPKEYSCEVIGNIHENPELLK